MWLDHYGGESLARRRAILPIFFSAEVILSQLLLFVLFIKCTTCLHSVKSKFFLDFCSYSDQTCSPNEKKKRKVPLCQNPAKSNSSSPDSLRHEAKNFSVTIFPSSPPRLFNSDGHTAAFSRVKTSLWIFYLHLSHLSYACN